MYGSGAAPLPPRIALEVVPPDLPAKPLWENGRQLRQHLKELLDRVSLLKAMYVTMDSVSRSIYVCMDSVYGLSSLPRVLV